MKIESDEGDQAADAKATIDSNKIHIKEITSCHVSVKVLKIKRKENILKKLEIKDILKLTMIRHLVFHRINWRWKTME